MSESKLMEEMAREIEALKNRVKQMEVRQRSLFPIWNYNTPAQLTAAVNNYDPGNYAILFMSSDASRNITGISSGIKGRILILINIGSENIVLVNTSASSTDINRLVLPNGANVTLGQGEGIILVYTGTRWRAAGVAV